MKLKNFSSIKPLWNSVVHHYSVDEALASKCALAITDAISTPISSSRDVHHNVTLQGDYSYRLYYAYDEDSWRLRIWKAFTEIYDEPVDLMIVKNRTKFIHYVLSILEDMHAHPVHRTGRQLPGPGLR